MLRGVKKWLEMREEDFLQSLSKGTRKSYKAGLRKFEKYFGKSVERILKLREQDLGSNDIHQKRRFEKEIEKFHQSLLDKGYGINTARTMTLGIIQIFRFYDMPMQKRYGSKISRTVMSTRDHVLTIFDIRQMYKVGDLRARTLLCMSKDLGWRISDFLSILRTEVEPMLEKKPPVPFRKLTKKEKVPAYSFLGDESLEHLKTFLPTLKPSNKWLWQGKKSNCKLDAESVNDLLKKLAKDAQLKLTGSLHFHAFRKLYMRTGVELGCNHWAIKMLVGKSVKSSDLTYISQAQLQETFLKINNVLRLQNRQHTTKIPSLEETLGLVLDVQKQELLQKVKKLWDEKYGQFMTSSDSTGTVGFLITEPDFETMTPKELLKEYLKLKKEM